MTAAVVALLRYLLEQIDKTSEDDDGRPGDAGRRRRGGRGARPRTRERKAAAEQRAAPRGLGEPAPAPVARSPPRPDVTQRPASAGRGRRQALAEHLGRARRPALRGPGRRQRVQHVVEPRTRRQVAQRLTDVEPAGRAPRSLPGLARGLLRREGDARRQRAQDTSGCTSTTCAGRQRVPLADLRADVERLQADRAPGQLRATANASSGVRAASTWPRWAGNTDDRARPSRRARRCRRPAVLPRGQAERDVDADREQPAVVSSTSAANGPPTTSPVRPPRARPPSRRAPRPHRRPPAMVQDKGSCASTSARSRRLRAQGSPDRPLVSLGHEPIDVGPRPTTPPTTTRLTVSLRRRPSSTTPAASAS